MLIRCAWCGYNPIQNTNYLIWWQRLTGKSPDNLEELQEIAFDAEDEDDYPKCKNEDSGSEETDTDGAEDVETEVDDPDPDDASE